MLRRRFSAVWITENAADLLAQANVEYAEWLEHNPPARNPVGWLLTCAYRRAQNLLDTQTRRPASTSLDSVLHLADDSAPTPEQQVIEQDRQDRLQTAIRHLPDKERKLLALVYFKDLSIREAGRILGWQKSAADRHHRAAMDKLQALVGDRSLLGLPALGAAAWAESYGGRDGLSRAADLILTPGRELIAFGGEAAGWTGRQLTDLGRRVAPLTDQAGAAATSGGGRLAGACGVAIASVVCGIAASGVVSTSDGVGLDGAIPLPGADRAGANLRLRPPSVIPQALVPAPTPAAGTEPQRKAANDSTAAPRQPKEKPTVLSRQPARSPSPESEAEVPAALPQVTEDNFGIEPPSSESSSPPPASTGGGTSPPGTSDGSNSTRPTTPRQEFGL